MPGAGVILVMGGTAEAVRVCRRLQVLGCRFVYSSVAPCDKLDNVRCGRTRHGSFENSETLWRFLARENVQLIIDATHPYAVMIKKQITEAVASETTVSVWRLHRRPWLPGAGDDWTEVSSLPEIKTRLQGWRRPFFAIGRSALALLPVPGHQHWCIRCLSHASSAPIAAHRVAFVAGKGPFQVAEEMALLRRHEIDVLVCKNSGSALVSAKLRAAAQLNIPVLMWSRPAPEPANREFDDIDALMRAIREEGYEKSLE